MTFKKFSDGVVRSKTWKAMGKKSEDIWRGSGAVIKENNKRLKKTVKKIRKDSDVKLRKTKGKYKRKLVALKDEGTRTAIKSGVAGAGLGAYGGMEYKDKENKKLLKTPELGKTASFGHASLDKEANRANIWKGVKGLVMKSRMGTGRVEKLKRLEATRQARDVNTSSLAAKHRTELASGNYKGMEKSLAKRQAKESKTARKAYNTSVNSQNLPNTKTLGAKPNPNTGVVGRQAQIDARRSLNTQKTRQLKANEYREARRTRDAGSQRLIKKQTREAQGAGGLNKIETQALKGKQNIAWLNHNNKYRTATGRSSISAPALTRKSVNQAWVKPVVPKTRVANPTQVGAVDLGKMNPVKPTVGLSLPAANMTNFKKGVMGAGAGVGALGVNDLLNGGGLGGSSRGTRVVNQY